MNLNGAVQDAPDRFRNHDFGDRDLVPRRLRPQPVHRGGGLQGHQPRLFDVAARLADGLPDRALFRERGPERYARLGAAAHRLDGAFGQTDEAHAMVDAAGPETALRDLE